MPVPTPAASGGNYSRIFTIPTVGSSNDLGDLLEVAAQNTGTYTLVMNKRTNVPALGNHALGQTVHSNGNSIIGTVRTVTFTVA